MNVSDSSSINRPAALDKRHRRKTFSLHRPRRYSGIEYGPMEFLTTPRMSCESTMCFLNSEYTLEDNLNFEWEKESPGKSITPSSDLYKRKRRHRIKHSQSLGNLLSRRKSQSASKGSFDSPPAAYDSRHRKETWHSQRCRCHSGMDNMRERRLSQSLDALVSQKSEFVVIISNPISKRWDK